MSLLRVVFVCSLSSRSLSSGVLAIRREDERREPREYYVHQAILGCASGRPTDERDARHVTVVGNCRRSYTRSGQVFLFLRFIERERGERE